MKLLSFAANLFFPVRCLYCSRLIGFLPKCEACENLLPQAKRNFENAVSIQNRELGFIKNAYALFVYEEPIRNAIIQMKFNDFPEKATIFGRLLGEQIKACKVIEKFDIIIPVPSTKRSTKMRGYDVPLFIAKSVKVHTKLPLIANSLLKEYETPKQTTLTGVQRRGNLAGAFAVRFSEEIIEKRVLLIDDVITTGTTVNECAKVLLYAGAESVSVACVAVADDQ